MSSARFRFLLNHKYLFDAKLINIQRTSFSTTIPALAKAQVKKEVKKKAPAFKQVRNEEKPKGKRSQSSNESSVGKSNPKFYKPKPIVEVEETKPGGLNVDVSGKVYTYPNDIMEKINVFGVPPIMSKEMKIFPKLSWIARDATLDLAKKLDGSKNKPSAETRIVLVGPLGVGKSSILLQIVGHALASDWIVIYIPSAIDLVNGKYAYVKLSSGDYVQPTLIAKILKQIHSVNRDKFAVQDSKTITDLIDRIKDPNTAQTALEQVLDKIDKSSMPVLLAIDEINALYATTEFTSPDHTLLEPGNLFLPRTLLEYISGQKKFRNGAVIGATSLVHKPTLSYALDAALHLTEVSPWKQVSPEIARYINKEVKSYRISEYSKNEAKALLDFYIRNNVVHEDAPTDESFTKKYMLSNGNARKFLEYCSKRL
ncbi:579_t:CDS:10 [Paraglomus brasilianum]|uniref:Small ribosomal subunit protein mS29 n=1 Tax=Paraglomus brasilianum TaxID=144538 RepID=A0A9N9G659_9GLOM|nr:579_t:CDS:10 [Paraglomus brasilianum]